MQCTALYCTVQLKTGNLRGRALTIVSQYRTSYNTGTYNITRVNAAGFILGFEPQLALMAAGATPARRRAPRGVCHIHTSVPLIRVGPLDHVVSEEAN
jgi:hypothetical protein